MVRYMLHYIWKPIVQKLCLKKIIFLQLNDSKWKSGRSYGKKIEFYVHLA